MTASRVLAARFMSTTPDVPAPVAGGAGELEKAQSWDNQPVVAYVAWYQMTGTADNIAEWQLRVMRQKFLIACVVCIKEFMILTFVFRMVHGYLDPSPASRMNISSARHAFSAPRGRPCPKA